MTEENPCYTVVRTPDGKYPLCEILEITELPNKTILLVHPISPKPKNPDYMLRIERYG